MNKIKLDNWFINDNELCISLMRFYVGIYVSVKDNELNYELKGVDIKGDELTLTFNTIEDAIAFTEDVINYSSDLDSIEAKCNGLYDDKVKKLERGKYGGKK